MQVKGKIAALIVAIATILLPFSQMACTRGTCLQHDSPSMLCHAMHAHQPTYGLEAVPDHSCCQLLPLVPTSARDRMIIRTAHQPVPMLLSNSGRAQTVPEIREERSLDNGPPELELQSLLCVRQI